MYHGAITYLSVLFLDLVSTRINHLNVLYDLQLEDRSTLRSKNLNWLLFTLRATIILATWDSDNIISLRSVIPFGKKVFLLTTSSSSQKSSILPSDFAAFASSNYSAKNSFSWGFDDSNNKLAPHRARPQVAATNLASEADYRGNKLSELGSVFLDLFEITSTSMLPISCSANNVMLCPLVWYQCLNLVILEKFSYMWL